MKRVLLPILLISAFWTNATTENHSQSKSETMQKQDKEAIEALLMTYKGSLNTSDPVLATSLYTKDGIFMPTEAPSAIGTENILQSYTFIFSQIQLNIEFYIDEIVVEGDMAFATTSSKGTVLIKEANVTLQEANRELFVFEKIGEEWKIARYMFNKTTPKAN
ncbi:MAG: hypothetical protein ACI83W_001193 [Marinoscillum sp.]|jgi:uncharacterized protein (TIGR02246 family)